MVLVSLLGKDDSSIFPILYEFKDKITCHIIIHDDSKFETSKTNNLLNIQNDFKFFYGLDFMTDSLKIDEDSYESLLLALDKIKEISKNGFENIYFNTTGGLSSSTAVLSPKILEQNGKFIAYDIFDNGFNIVTKDNLIKKQIENNLDIFTHLLLKGYKIITIGSKMDAFKRKNEILQICEDIEELKNFTSLLHSNNSSNIYGFERIKDLLTQIDKLNDKSFIQGTIFEEYIYWLIEDNFDFNQVMFNVKIEFKENLFNEFDILMIKDNHLHAIECKLRTSISGENVVYKIDSIIDYLDDDGKAMILAIGGENERISKNGNIKKQFTNGTLKRAENSNIKIHQSKYFDKKVFLEEIKEHFFK
jgi:hypothetical protein